MNNRRRLVIALGTAASMPHTVFAQAKRPPVMIGLLATGLRTAEERVVAEFKEGMAALGWREGENYRLEERWAEGRVDRLPSLAEELARKQPAVIVAYNGPATNAAANAAPNTPIVQASGNSPVARGLAASLSHPGGMVTGLTNINTQLSTKYLELLLAAAPKLKRIGFLVDRNTSGYAAHINNARNAGEYYRVEVRFAEVAKPEELEPAIERLAKEGVEGLVLLPTVISTHRQRVIRLALAHRWPVITSSRGSVEAGALLNYTAAPAALYRRAAYYVDRILKGTKPGDLPIEQPMTFELTVNMKTAKALGLRMPPEIMVRATRVIE